MSDETTATDRQPEAAPPRPGFVPPVDPRAAPAAYGASPVPPAPPAAVPPTPPFPEPAAAPAAYGAQQQQQHEPQPQEPEQEHHWTADGLVSTPALPPERVGRGASLALLAIPVGVLLSALIWKLGFVASISGVVMSAGAALLYARGSGGRIRKGVPIIAGVIVVGIVGSFFAAVAVDLFDVFPQLDPDIAATYPSRGNFVWNNLFYGPVLKEYTRDLVLFVLFGVLGGFGTIIRLARMNATSQR